MSAGVPSRAEYLARWSELHGGYEPASSRLTGGWLALVYVLAAPLARRRVPPDAVTMLGALAAGAVVWLGALGGRWVLAAAAVVVLSGLLDNLDGAVAVLTDRATRWGYVLDSVVDRVCDALYLVALWVVGAPPWVCVLAGALTGLQEYARARAGAAGMSEVGVVTVSERPTRVIVTAMFLLGAGLSPPSAAQWATWGAYAWLALGVVGLVQLLATIRRTLHPHPASGDPHVE